MLSIAADAWPYLAWLGGLIAVSWVFGWCFLGTVFVLLAGFVTFFFRDPEREIKFNPEHALSPADGKVMTVTDIEHDEFIDGPAKKVSIFLSIFSVHINRSPITGKIVARKYRAGKMLPAYKSHASEENERNTIVIQGEKAKVAVHQITGLIARRIVCRVDAGDRLVQGGRYGMIKFGSCTELIVPASAEIVVGEGEMVTGGETVLAIFK